MLLRMEYKNKPIPTSLIGQVGMGALYSVLSNMYSAISLPQI